MINYFRTYGNVKLFNAFVEEAVKLGYNEPTFVFDSRMLYIFLNETGQISYSQNTGFIKDDSNDYRLRPAEDLLDPEKNEKLSFERLEVNGYKVFVRDKKLWFGCQVICADDVEKIIKLWIKEFENGIS